MDTRDLLERRLQTLDTLSSGALQRGVSDANGQDALENELERQWKTEARLIKRVLSEDADPTDTLLTWRERTEAFQEQYPDRDGWTDKQENQWQAELVLEAISNLLDHIDNWTTEVDFSLDTEEN